MQQCLERRAGELDAAVLEVVHRDGFLGLDDVVQTIHEVLDGLQLGPQHVLGENRVRGGEHAAEEGGHEALGDAVAEAAGFDGFAVVHEVLNLFQIAVFDQIRWLALGDEHARPDLRDEQADVVIHAVFAADVAGGAGEAVVVRQQEGNERGVHIVDRQDRVEGALGERALAARAGGGRALAGERGDEIHEQLGQFLIVDRPVDGERADAGGLVRRIVPAAGEHRVHRHRHGGIQRQAAVEARAEIRQIDRARVFEVRPVLQVARVLGRLAIDDPRLVRADHELRFCRLHESS